MITVTVMADKNMATALKYVKEFAQICDSKGRIIGTFTPSQRFDNH